MNDITVTVQPNITVSATVAMQGVPGAAGVDMVSAAMDSNKHLIITLSDASTIDAGLMPTGDDGVSIVSTAVDGNSHLIVTLSNGSTIDAGLVPRGIDGVTGPQGIQGVPGADGYTPIKGIDYFDGATGSQGIQGVPGADGYTPVKGIDYFDGATGPQGIQGVPGANGATLNHASQHLNNSTDPLPANNWHGVVISRPASRGALPTNVTTTTFTLSALANPFDYYYQGVKKTVNTDRTVTIETSTGSGVSTAGLYHIYFDGNDVLRCASSFNPFLDTGVYIANVYWNGTNYGIVSDERHSYTRDRSDNGHKWQHKYVGCRYGSGLGFSFAGTTNANTTFAVSAGTIADEDIEFSITDQTQCRVWYQTGANTYTFVNTLSTLPYYYTTGILAVNGSTYTLVTPVTSSTRYFNYWVYATTSLLAPIHVFCETVAVGNIGGYTSVANARLATPPNLSSFGLSAEWKLLHRVVVNGAGLVQAYVSANDDYRTSSSLPSGGTVSVQHDGTSPQLAASGVTYGHVDDQAQTIAGAKTFSNDMVVSTTASIGSIANGTNVRFRVGGYLSSGNTTEYGAAISPYFASTVTGTGYGIRVDLLTQNAAFTMGTATAISVGPNSLQGSSVVTNYRGISVNNTAMGSTSRIALELLMVAATGAWNIYASGTAINHMAGALLIGTATTLTSSAAKLEVNGSLYSTGIIQPSRTVTNADATSVATDYTIRMSTGSSNRNVTAMNVFAVGQIVVIKKIDSGTGTVGFTSTGTCTIDGSTARVLTNQYEVIRLQCVTAGTNCVFDII